MSQSSRNSPCLGVLGSLSNNDTLGIRGFFSRATRSCRRVSAALRPKAGETNGSENVTKKVNSRCIKLHCPYSNSFNLSNDGDFFRNLILKDSHPVVLCLRPPQNVKLESSTCSSRTVTVKKCTKSVMHVQSCCFANLLPFCRSRCRRRRRCLAPYCRFHAGVAFKPPKLRNF